jgi:hypothetical protein
VVQNIGLSEDPSNHLLRHAMAPNVSGVIGSAVAAGILLSFWFKLDMFKLDISTIGMTKLNGRGH